VITETWLPSVACALHHTPFQAFHHSLYAYLCISTLLTYCILTTVFDGSLSHHQLSRHISASFRFMACWTSLSLSAFHRFSFPHMFFCPPSHNCNVNAAVIHSLSPSSFLPYPSNKPPAPFAHLHFHHRVASASHSPDSSIIVSIIDSRHVLLYLHLSFRCAPNAVFIVPSPIPRMGLSSIV